jgi:hypothetical protein
MKKYAEEYKVLSGFPGIIFFLLIATLLLQTLQNVAIQSNV